jgi:hypothetical protein
VKGNRLLAQLFDGIELEQKVELTYQDRTTFGRQEIAAPSRHLQQTTRPKLDDEREE